MNGHNDRDRLFSMMAERITGYLREDVVGKPCMLMDGPHCSGFGKVYEILRNKMKSLKSIGTTESGQVWPAAEFWARYEKGEFKK